MRGRPCSICQHDDLTAIDAALAAGNTILHVASTFGIPKSSVHRHKLNCLGPKIKAAAKAMRTTKEVQAPVQKAKQIVAGTTLTVEEVLGLHALLERVARSLSRLEGAADFAAGENMCTSLASVSNQIFRGVEVAARLQGIGHSDAPQAQQDKFSITIQLPQLDAKPVTIDCTPSRGGSEAGDDSVPQVTVPQVTVRRRSFACDFDLDQDPE